MTKRPFVKGVLLLMAALFTITSYSGVQAAEKIEPGDVYAKHGMVSSAHELASQAGVEVLKKGGNAVDAAVATALALNVVEFNASGIGGGGFTTIRFARTGEVVCLDYREMAPASSTKDMFSSKQSEKERWSIDGGKAVGVPGWIEGMWYALEKYGTMSFAEVAVPAIRLAEEGFVLHPMQNGIITDNFDRLTKYNPTDQVPYFKDGLPLAAGETLKQPNLGKLFRLIGDKGPRAFYEGPVAEAIVRAVNSNGGNMTLDDLKNYGMEIRKPVTGTYRGYKIYSMPPSSSGGAHLIQLLNIMELFPMSAYGHNSPRSMHVFAEACKMIFADRTAYMADTAFTQVPLEGLISKAYAKALAAQIDLNQVAQEVRAGNPWKFQNEQKKADIRGLGPEMVSTSSFSTVDAEGNIVASTNTINFFCGSGVLVPEYGFLLNDEMDDFSPNPNSVNAPEPGKRPLSSMSPTIVLDPKGRPYMSIGAAGATRIFTSIAQVVMNTVDYDMTMGEAIQAPRVHNQLSGGKAGKFMTEKHMDGALIDWMTLRGYDIQKDVHIGTVQGILFDGGKGLINGGADFRRLGVPAGY